MELSPKHEYNLNWDNVRRYISNVSKNQQEVTAMTKFFEVTKYVSFTEFVDTLRRVVDVFNAKIKTNDYVACLFTIGFGEIDNKSNMWVYNIMLKLGLKVPKYVIKTEQDLDLLINFKNIPSDFVFFDDGAFSGYQMFDTVYNTFLYSLYQKGYSQHVHTWILLGYASQRSIDIFSLLSPDGKLKVPLEKLPIRFQDFDVVNNVIRNNTELTIIYGESMKTLAESLSGDVLNTLEYMGIKDYKIPIYFSHKMPDFLSSYSEIYIGFTLHPPYQIIPLINNCEQYYNQELLDRVHTLEDIEDITRDAPCPVSPYK